MGMRKLGDTIILDFTTHNPVTGYVQDADSLPTCEVFEDENDTAILTPIVTKRDSKTGDYRVSIVTTTANGFAVGSSYNIIVFAIVGYVPAKGRIGSFTLDSKRNSDLIDLALSQIEASTVIAKETTVGQIKAETDKIADIKDWVQILKSIGVGRWKIIENQLKIYDEDNNVLLTFDLKDKEGQVTSENVYERVPVD